MITFKPVRITDLSFHKAMLFLTLVEGFFFTFNVNYFMTL